MAAGSRSRGLVATIGLVFALVLGTLAAPGVADARPGAEAPAGPVGCAPSSPLGDGVAAESGAGAVSGQSAIDALGPAGLAAVASHSAMEVDALAAELLDDASLQVDRCGMLRTVDPASPETDLDTGTDGAEPVANGPFPSNQTFLLHSRPGANRVLFVDFGGEQIPATSVWARDYNGGNAFAATPFDMDGAPATFSESERDMIQAVWQRVSEDYRPFGIDVTTQDPGVAAIQRTSVADQEYGVRALVTNDIVVGNNCSGCAGIAYIDVFNRTFNGTYFSDLETTMPAWTFNDGTMGARDLAEITSHEVGHTFGLLHDGTAAQTYYPGHNFWAPIMGSGYRSISQFSKGEYAGASQTQDDLAIVATGAAVVADEAGGTIATAAVLAPGPAPVATGTITSATDKDLYRFTAAGPTTIEVRGADVGANLDIRADLLTAAGATVATNDPAAFAVNSSTAGGLNASITMTLAAGDYVVGIDGVGSGNASNTGYSDYGSVGAYRVTIATDVAATPARFHPLVPGRVLDSRPGGTNVGDFSTPWPAGAAGARDVQIGGRAGVPVGATAVVLNVTVVNPTAGSFLQLWPTGSPQPTFGSSLNFGPGQIVPNAVTVKLGTSGRLRVFNAVGTTDVIIDVAGYYDDGAGGAGFTALTPARVVDSRPGPTNVGAFSTPWQPGVPGTRDVQIGGLGGVPADAEAVVLNVTVVNPNAGSFLQLWPTGATQPGFGSSLNFNPGQIVPNQVTVKLGTEGKVRVFNAVGNVDVIIDVSGYYRTGSGKDFYAVVPGRVLDSRSGSSNIGPFATPWQAGTPGIRDVSVGGLAGVPADADGVVMNVTVVNPTALSFLQLWPTGAAQPTLGSSLNFNPGQIVPNAVTVKLGTAGTVRVFNAAGRVDVIADVAGYFA